MPTLTPQQLTTINTILGLRPNTEFHDASTEADKRDGIILLETARHGREIETARDITLRILDEQSYTDPKPEHYEKRGLFLFKTTEAELRQALTRAHDPQEKVRIKIQQRALVFEKAIFLRRIKAVFVGFDFNIMKEREKTRLHTDKAVTHFKPLHKTALKLLQKEVSATIARIMQKPDEEDATLALRRLREAEKQWVAKKGRPTIAHVYEASVDTQPSNTRIILSVHIPVGQLTQEQVNKKEAHEGDLYSHGAGIDAGNPVYTNPSTIRDTEGESNFIRHEVWDMTDPDHPVKLFSTYRHSSHLPFAERNDLLCQAKTYRNIEQILTEAAEQRWQQLKAQDTTLDLSNHTEQHPLHIFIGSMSLLSPIESTLIQKAQGEEYDHHQFETSKFALEAYRNQPIQVSLANGMVWVQPDFSIMTLGVNELRLISQDQKDSLPSRTNPVGFLDYHNAIYNFLTQQMPTNEHLKNLINQLNECEKNRREYASLQQQQIDQKRQELTELYRQTQTFVKQYEESVLQKAPTLNQLTAFKKLKEQIKTMECELVESVNVLLEHSLKAIFTVNKLGYNELMAKVQRSELSEKDKKVLDIILLFQNAQELYFNDQYDENDQCYQFQAYFVYSLALTQAFTEFYCKSGEDRTGRLDNTIEALALLSLLTNTSVPKKLSDDVWIRLSMLIHACSPSWATCGANSPGADALQLQHALKHLELASTLETLGNAVLKFTLNLENPQTITDVIKGAADNAFGNGPIMASDFALPVAKTAKQALEVSNQYLTKQCYLWQAAQMINPELECLFVEHDVELTNPMIHEINSCLIPETFPKAEIPWLYRNSQCKTFSLDELALYLNRHGIEHQKRTAITQTLTHDSERLDRINAINQGLWAISPFNVYAKVIAIGEHIVNERTQLLTTIETLLAKVQTLPEVTNATPAADAACTYYYLLWRQRQLVELQENIQDFFKQQTFNYAALAALDARQAPTLYLKIQLEFQAYQQRQAFYNESYAKNPVFEKHKVFEQTTDQAKTITTRITTSVQLEQKRHVIEERLKAVEKCLKTPPHAFTPEQFNGVAVTRAGKGSCQETYYLRIIDRSELRHASARFEPHQYTVSLPSEKKSFFWSSSHSTTEKMFFYEYSSTGNRFKIPLNPKKQQKIQEQDKLFIEAAVHQTMANLITEPECNYNQQHNYLELCQTYAAQYIRACSFVLQSYQLSPEDRPKCPKVLSTELLTHAYANLQAIGLAPTNEEVKNYLNTIEESGAEDFTTAPTLGTEESDRGFQEAAVSARLPESPIAPSPLAPSEVDMSNEEDPDWMEILRDGL